MTNSSTPTPYRYTNRRGSEYPAVVIPLLTQHYVMLQRNLLYTAITRGKKLVVIVGTKKALRIAVRERQDEKKIHAVSGTTAGRSVALR